MRKDWRFVKIGEVCKTGAGGTPLKSKKEYYEDGTIPWLLSGEVAQGEINSSKKFITEAGLKNSSAKIFPRNTVLVAMYGATAGQLGILRFEAATNQAVCGILPNDELLPEYIFYALLQKQSDLIATAAGNAQPNISQIKVKNTEIPLPLLSEQKQIVAILDQAFEGIDAAMANTKKNLANARELFDSYLDAIFLQKNEECIEKPLESICHFSSGGTPSKKNSSFWEGSIPWVSGRDMKSTRLFDSALHISQSAVDQSSTRMAPTGALLTLVRGMGLAHGAQITELMVPCAFNQDIRAIQPDRDIVPRYLLFALRTRIDSSDNVLSHAAHGTLKINMDGLKKVEIPLPNTKRQKQFVHRIDMLFEETQLLKSNYKQKLAALAELKQSLLTKAFSGELTAQPDQVLKEAVG